MDRQYLFAAGAGLALAACAILPSCSCAPPPKPVASPRTDARMPPQETVAVDFDKILIPPSRDEVVTSKSLDKFCRVLVASSARRSDSNNGKDDVKASGASSEPEELRILRRAIMMQKRDVVTGEVAARVSAEVVGSGGTQEAVARFNALTDAERLVLLAEKTGAQALLVLDQYGTWKQEVIAEVAEDGSVRLRDKSQGEAPRFCEDSPAKLLVNQWMVGIRAKLVSLKKNDASILADIDMFAPLGEPVGAKTFEKWSFTPVTATDQCADYLLNRQTNQWMCAPARFVSDYQKSSVWCNAMVSSLVKTNDDIRAVRYMPKFEQLAKRLAERLFRLQENCIPEPEPPPPAASAPPPPPDKKPGKKK